ncbi:MAG: sigma-70 family RNA polymerase sigma factor [Clostridium sp.]
MFTLNRVSKGDFEEFIVSSQVYLYKIAYTYVKSEATALDIVQESILKAYKSIGKIKSKDNLKSYITRIIINTSLTHIKKEEKIVLYDPDILSKTIEEGEEYIETRVDIGVLDNDLKGIIILKYYEGYTINEIGNLLDTPISTVKNKLHKALNILRESMEEGNYE